MKITSVTALNAYKLKVTFEDGISGVIDLSDFVTTGIFAPLSDTNLFNKVYTNGYSIAWSNELEIDAIAIYAEIVNKGPEEILNVNYATN